MNATANLCLFICLFVYLFIYMHTVLYVLQSRRNSLCNMSNVTILVQLKVFWRWWTFGKMGGANYSFVSHSDALSSYTVLLGKDNVTEQTHTVWVRHAHCPERPIIVFQTEWIP